MNNTTAPKIDRRKKYIIVIDTETCNGIVSKTGQLDLKDSLVYDLGLAVIDKRGNIYETRSFVIRDTFYGMSDVMKSAYYADKIPMYHKDVWDGKRKVVSFLEAKLVLRDIMEKYRTNVICAHNALFDYRALNTTQRYLTKSAFRYFFPYNVEFWDSLKMARSVMGQMKTYQRFCQENDYMTRHKKPQCRFTAEICYKYIINDTNFTESHTGLEDVLIEAQIVAYCIKQHKKMKKLLFENSEKK